MSRHSRLVTAVLTASVLFGIAGTAVAQNVVVGVEDYLTPPKAIADVITSEAMHNKESFGNLGPDGEHFLLSHNAGMPPLRHVGRPYVNLGETSFDHRANRARSLSMGSTVGYELVSWKTGKRTRVKVPDGLAISGVQWSPNGKQIAFMGHGDRATHLYVADVVNGATRRATDTPLNASLVTSFSWSGDSRKLVCVLIPKDRGPMPTRDPVAREPRVWVGHDGATPTRTYRFLLKTPYDKALLEYLTTGQLALIEAQNGKITPVGKPAMITRVNASPDGRHFRVTQMLKPFSYFVPQRSFGTREEIWDTDGKALHQINERKLQDLTPRQPTNRTRTRTPNAPRAPGASRRGAAAAGQNDTKRSLGWRPDGRGMTFLQREPAPKKDAKDAPKKPAGGKSDAKKGDKKPARKAAPKKRGKKAQPVKKTDAKKATGKKSDKLATGKKPDKLATGKKPTPKKPAKSTRSKAPTKDAKKGKQEKPAEKKAEPKKPAPRKDRVMQWLPPFNDKSMKVVWESEDPISSVRYSDDCRTLFITTSKDGATKTFAVNLRKPKERLKIQETKREAAPANQADAMTRAMRRMRRGGGRAGMMMKRGSQGGSVVRTSRDRKWVYYSGSDEPKDKTKESARPWIDRYEIGTGKKERVWSAKKDGLESVAAVIDDDLSKLVISRQTAKEVPNNHLHDVKTNARTQLSHNIDPAPQVTRAKRERFQVTRVDGFKFWVNVTIPRDHGEKLPAMFWFYPREFTDQKSYDQRVREPDPNRFPTIRNRSMSLLTMLGYVVVEPDCPIIGPEGRPNDNYVADLRNSLWAVIDDLDRRNIIDRNRLALGGHSYGAFSTANAMIHTPFFKAGIAGDGNYNRTLTPMSFQAERRYLWDARETYIRMSPVLWANQLNGALLMYHGMDDANTGTFPINSPRMFQALSGLGKPVSLYQYPYEGHGPRAHETILDLWARWVEWLDIFVKNPERAKNLHAKPQPKQAIEGGDRR